MDPKHLGLTLSLLGDPRRNICSQCMMLRQVENIKPGTVFHSTVLKPAFLYQDGYHVGGASLAVCKWRE